MKQCTKCKVEKELSVFSKKKASKDGRRPTCKPCDKEYRLKKKKEASEIILSDDEKICSNCHRTFPNSEFRSNVVRRTTLTTMCITCRESTQKSHKKSTTTAGQCKLWWVEWKKTHPCVMDGCTTNDWRLIQADHIEPKSITDEKVHSLSDYYWWACYGGIDAMVEESTKCQPLCQFHHRQKTKDERNSTTHPSIIQKRDQINAIKRDDHKDCFVCKRPCIEGDEHLFDFDHIDPEKKVIGVSRLVHKSRLYFNEHLDSEIAKCQLLCCGCHHLKTHYN